MHKLRTAGQESVKKDIMAAGPFWIITEAVVVMSEWLGRIEVVRRRVRVFVTEWDTLKCQGRAREITRFQ